jgi:S1-C subfamily serine protease
MWSWGEIVETGTKFDDVPDLIRASAAVQQGDSGGPLIDVNGYAIGITVRMNSKTRYGLFVTTDVVLKLLSP